MGFWRARGSACNLQQACVRLARRGRRRLRLRRLEHDVQDLELQAEGLRAAYVLNQEKLSFSHHLLTQREAESRVLSQKLKRQVAAQGRSLGSLKVLPRQRCRWVLLRAPARCSWGARWPACRWQAHGAAVSPLCGVRVNSRASQPASQPAHKGKFHACEACGIRQASWGAGS